MIFMKLSCRISSAMYLSEIYLRHNAKRYPDQVSYSFFIAALSLFRISLTSLFSLLVPKLNFMTATAAIPLPSITFAGQCYSTMLYFLVL